ncbi:carbohydrate kinase family protein [Lentibacillus salicampi]|uniref:Carbohydrate kinase n=1 Tax=Lentibacillus salicampi TaxID=175306 RepID=A0A4Y9AB89_9BACI|nr:carbohydrate kinase family protein [Lentibacillus salicampi]TFJ93188.1 carbohydrate kinase [Lentibacillus salicampi]
MNTNEASPIICIGGSNVDRKFYLNQQIIQGTSNPVSSSSSVGGVARNIAENLGRLGGNVKLITAGGNDAAWKEIAQASSPFMDLDFAAQYENQSTGNYTAVLDERGDLSVAFADMDIFDDITPELLQRNQAILQQAACIVADLNCPAETIDFLCSFTAQEAIPLVVIPVSAPKMDRLPRSLSSVSWLIVNKDETETFLNIDIQTDQDWKESVKKWLDSGVENVVVTNGSEGAMAGAQSGETGHYQAVETPDIIDVTGAGDSFCSAVIHAWLQKQPLDAIIQSGMVNAHKTILSNETVRTDLSFNQLAEDVQRINASGNH